MNKLIIGIVIGIFLTSGIAFASSMRSEQIFTVENRGLYGDVNIHKIVDGNNVCYLFLYKQDTRSGGISCFKQK